MQNLLSFSSVMSSVWSVVLAVLVLLVMVTVHEFGHYVAGKALHFGITEFSIGFGPAIFKKKRKNGELFALRLIPLGGYCAFLGESGEEEDLKNDPSAFNNRKPWQRIVVLLSGAAMNFLTALLCIVISFVAFGQILLGVYKAEPLQPYEIAEYGGYSFMDGDIILSVNGRDCYLSTDVMKVVGGGKKGDVFTFEILRNREKITQKIKLRTDADVGSVTEINTVYQSLGVAKDADGNYEMRSYLWKLGFFEAIAKAFVYAFRIAGTIFTILGQLFTGRLGLSAFGGPITTISVTSKIVSLGFLQFLEIVSYIGVNLAVFNLLPIPALDGSKVVFTVIEWIRKKPVNRKVENAIHVVGLFLLFGFAILVDILQFV